MPDEIDVSVASDWELHPERPYVTCTLNVRLLRLHPPGKQLDLNPDDLARFYSAFEHRFTPHVLVHLRKADPNIYVSLSCFGGRAGSFDFGVFILAAASTVTLGGLYKFVADYKKFKEGLAEIVKDIKDSSRWLETTAANFFDWISTGSSASESMRQDQIPLTSDEIRNLVEGLEENENRLHEKRLSDIRKLGSVYRDKTE